MQNWLIDLQKNDVKLVESVFDVKKGKRKSRDARTFSQKKFLTMETHERPLRWLIYLALRKNSLKLVYWMFFLFERKLKQWKFY